MAIVPWSTAFRLRQHVREALWAVPLLGAIVGALLAQVDLALEGSISPPPGWSYSAGTASSVLAAIAGAMVGLIGLVVTIGVLVVQMATGTLSARFMRLWYRDRVQKVTLAAFTATFTFTYALLRRVEADSVPHLGVTFAGVVVTIDLLLLLVYLDRFVHMLRPVAVAADMADSGLAIIGKLASQSFTPELMEDAQRLGSQRCAMEPDMRVLATRSGAVQAVHKEGLVSWAAARDVVCVLPIAMGDFVSVGDVLVDVHGVVVPGDEQRVRGMVALGEERTLDQDPAFALRILVDIAIRALSPAVNDPTTGTQMINYIGTLLTGLGTSAPAWRGAWPGPDGQVRLVVRTRTWEDYLQLGVSEVRQYGITSAQISRRLRAMLLDLERSVPPERRPAVAQQRRILDEMVTTAFPNPDERAFALGQDHQGIGGSTRGGRGEDVLGGAGL